MFCVVAELGLRAATSDPGECGAVPRKHPAERMNVEPLKPQPRALAAGELFTRTATNGSAPCARVRVCRRSGRETPPEPSPPRAREWRALVELASFLQLVLWLVLPSLAFGAADNLLAGRDPVQADGVAAGGRLTDGTATWVGGSWDTDLAVRFPDSGHGVTFDLGKPRQLGALYLQADHNDRYRVSVSNDGAGFKTLWVAPAVGRLSGMQPRFKTGLRQRARYLRLEPASGDGIFAVDEFQAFSDPEAPEPALARKPGVPLEIGVRTWVLFVVASFGVALWLTSAGAPRWWVLVCMALPAVALAGSFQAMRVAWPLEARQVSLVRASAAAIAACAVLRESFASKAHPAHRGMLVSSLGIAAAGALLAFYNLGHPQFWDHAERRPLAVHVLDLRQYYGTAKYFDELGYRGLYQADVAAYVEDVPKATLDSLANTPMRDLRTHRMSTVAAQRTAIETTRERFSADRWQQYKRDAAYFRKVMGESDFLHYMRDFGGNATPVWVSLAYGLFGSFEASTGAFWLTGLLDPLLLLVAFGAVGLTFGARSAALVMVIFGANDFVMYGSNWAGSTLRHDWLVWLALGACAMRRGWPRTAGVCWGLATLIRAFPGLAILGASLPAAWWWLDRFRKERRPPALSELRAAQGPTINMLASAGLCAALLIAGTSARWGFSAWQDWFDKVRVLSADTHGNAIALKGLLGGWEPGINATLQQRWPLYAGAVACNLGTAFLLSKRLRPEQSALLWLGLVAVVFYPANYYLHVVCLLPLVVSEPQSLQAASASRREAPRDSSAGRLAGMFWLVLLGLCGAQYWTVLVTPLPLRFHLSTVLWFGAWTTLLLLLSRQQLAAGASNPLDWLRKRLPGRPLEAPFPGE